MRPATALSRAPEKRRGTARTAGDLASLGDEGGTAALTPYTAVASSQYQQLMRANSSGYDLHLAKRVSDLAYSMISRIAPGKGVRSIPEAELPERFRRMRTLADGSLRRDATTVYYRLATDLPAYTITCYFTNVSSGAFTHPRENRALTIREAARLQSFPDSFQFALPNVKRHIGNAVPPMLARAIAEHILRSNNSIAAVAHQSSQKLARQLRLIEAV